MTIEVGQVLTLTIDRTAEYGVYLVNEEDDSVLLHKNDTDQELLTEGEKVDVFIYRDKQGRIAATTHIPEMLNDEYGWAEVVAVDEKIGAFVHLGFAKDIVVSGDDLPKLKQLWPAVGDKLFITLRVDRLDRLFARLATESVILDYAYAAPIEMKNQNFSGRVYRLLKVGTFVFTEEGYRCFIHENERTAEPRLGELIEGRVIGITEEGDINGSLLPRSYERIDRDSELLMNYLVQRSGTMPFTDKSAPEEIEKHFSISKAAFKRALGKLMKSGKIVQKDGFTSVVEDPEEDKE